MLFVVEAVFLKSKSFLKDDSPYILKHEQLHFDICEVNTRKLRKAIMEKDFSKVKDIVAVITKIYNKAAEELTKEQYAYDGDTQNGMNGAKQKLWNERIEKELLELDGFSSTQIDIANK